MMVEEVIEISTIPENLKNIDFSISKGLRPLPLVLFGSSGCLVGFRRFHFGILGDHFSTSGAASGSILAPWDHPGGP